MRTYCITTDSNSDLPQEHIEKLGTTTIPQYYSFGDTVYGDELHAAFTYLISNKLSASIINHIL